MKKYLVLAFCCLPLPGIAQLRLSEKPVAGGAVQILYDRPGAHFIVLSYDRNGKAQEQNISGVSLRVPDSAIALHIIATLPDGETDNHHGQGWLFPVYGNEKPLPMAYYRLSQLASGVPPDKGRLKGSIQRQLEFLRLEFSVNPAASNTFRQQYFNLLANSPEPSDKSELIARLLAYVTDDEMELTMGQRYLFYLGQRAAADSLAALLRSRFPSGRFVREERLQAVREEKDMAVKTRLYNDFLHQFPAGETFELKTLHEHMALAALQHGDEKAAARYFRRIANRQDLVSAYTQAAQALAAEPDKAIPWAEKAVQATDTASTYVSWNGYLAMASLLSARNDHRKALQYALPAWRRSHSKEATDLYTRLLVADGQYAEAQEILEDAVREKRASVQMKSRLEDIYGKTGGRPAIAASGPDSSLARRIRSEMLRETISSLSLKDISGQTVSLASFKGKIVVLDFWATWCKPCIASFPAMQQVMKQYPDVVFLYIATFEKGDAAENVKQFAQKNPYPFRYLLDEPLAGSLFKAYAHFKATGVPYKLVLDKEGAIRFRSGGFTGNDDELIHEMSAVIGVLR